MPVSVTKYRCAHKCGMTAVESLKRMERHEALCWKNPENKTCITCKHEVYIKTEADIGDFGRVLTAAYAMRECKLPEGEALIEPIYESKLKMDEMHIKPLTNCPYWEKK